MEGLVDQVVQGYHSGFARSIQNYSQILQLFTEAKEQVGANAVGPLLWLLKHSARSVVSAAPADCERGHQISCTHAAEMHTQVPGARHISRITPSQAVQQHAASASQEVPCFTIVSHAARAGLHSIHITSLSVSACCPGRQVDSLKKSLTDASRQLGTQSRQLQLQVRQQAPSQIVLANLRQSSPSQSSATPAAPRAPPHAALTCHATCTHRAYVGPPQLPSCTQSSQLIMPTHTHLMPDLAPAQQLPASLKGCQAPHTHQAIQ